MDYIWQPTLKCVFLPLSLWPVVSTSQTWAPSWCQQIWPFSSLAQQVPGKQRLYYCLTSNSCVWMVRDLGRKKGERAVHDKVRGIGSENYEAKEQVWSLHHVRVCAQESLSDQQRPLSICPRNLCPVKGMQRTGLAGAATSNRVLT